MNDPLVTQKPHPSNFKGNNSNNTSNNGNIINKTIKIKHFNNK